MFLFAHLQTKLLVVTDVAARGIDVPLLNNVVNYAFTPAPKLFVHRVGRAARQGRTGTVSEKKILACWMAFQGTDFSVCVCGLASFRNLGVSYR